MKLFEFLESLPWALGASLVVALFVILTVCGIILVRKCVSIKTLRAHHDVAGYVFANIGVLYSVLLGFTAVNVQQRFDKVKDISSMEASYVGDLYRDAQVFGEKDKVILRKAIIGYGTSVIRDEWPAMSKGEPNIETSQALTEVWNAYYAIDLKNTKQELWYTASIQTLNQLISARLERLLGGEESLGNEMWTLLILGAVVISSFMWFFGLENLTSQIIMSSLLAASAAFLLFLIYSLDTAFSGSVSVAPQAMETIVQSLNPAFIVNY